MTEMEAIERAYQDMQHGDAEVRADAIKVLGEAQYAPAVPTLMTILREADPGTRYLAANALSKIGEEAEAAIPELLDALRADDMFLRAAVTGALINIGYPSVPGLTKALFDRNKAVRRAAAKALGKIGSERAVSALAVAMKDGDKGVRHFAVEALQRIDTPEARDLLNE